MSGNRIANADNDDHERLIEIWEASVRATHHFLAEEDVAYYKSHMPNYFAAVHLFVIYDNELISGFMGLSDGQIQMLFINPTLRGKGLGKQLVRFAGNEFGVNKVEVNEQNAQAVGFYERMGFRITGRSEADHAGKPYPLLKMEISIL